MIYDYCPYRQQAGYCHRIDLPDKGMVVESGDRFTIAMRDEIKRRNIKLRRTEKYVVINDKFRVVWTKDNWDMCTLIGDLFEFTGINCALADYIYEFEFKGE